MVSQRRAVYDALLRCTRPARLWDLYAFVGCPSRFSNTNPKVRLLNEYWRLLGMGFYQASMRAIEDGSFTLSNEWWRISSVNSNYTMSPTYPFALLLPKSIRWGFVFCFAIFLGFSNCYFGIYLMAFRSAYFSDDKVLQACTFRARCRLPSITWCDRGLRKFSSLDSFVLILLGRCLYFASVRNRGCSCTIFSTSGWTHDEYEKVIQNYMMPFLLWISVLGLFSWKNKWAVKDL